MCSCTVVVVPAFRKGEQCMVLFGFIVYIGICAWVCTNYVNEWVAEATGLHRYIVAVLTGLICGGLWAAVVGRVM